MGQDSILYEARVNHLRGKSQSFMGQELSIVTYAGIRTTTGLGQAECGYVLPSGHFRQVLRLLFFSAKEKDPLEANGLGPYSKEINGRQQWSKYDNDKQ